MARRRMPSKVGAYQESACKSLSRIFGEDNVRKEWDVAKNSQDDFTRELYCPRLDIAVGPFNIDGNVNWNIEEMERVVHIRRSFIKRLLNHSETPHIEIEEFLSNKNQNPRCFLAIEIENSGSSKHMLGDVANVSILGSIGIIVPFNDKKLSLCKRIKQYVGFATEVGKTNVVFKNVLILNKANFWKAISGHRACH